MRQVQIPGTDLTVSAICLGTSGFGATAPEPLAYALLDAFVEQGGNFIDSALIYSDWIPGPKSITEKTVGGWLKTRGLRNQITLSTKGAHPELATMHVPRLSRADIIGDLNQSLTNLQTDHIDLYWLHRDDPQTPVSEIIDTLHGQVEAGKIRYFGCSNWSIGRIGEAQDYATQRGIQGFAANQPMWSLAEVNFAKLPDQTLIVMDEAGMAFHRRTGMPAIPYTSQAHGFFTKMDAKGRSALSAQDDASYINDLNLRRLAQVQALAKRYNVPVGTIVLSYLCSQPFVTVPVVGCKRLEQLQASMEAADLLMTSEEVEALEAV